MPINSRIFMIGWEYPPHNSGGLGVACQGLTEALAHQHKVYFTLPYSYAKGLSHVTLLDCSHPDWNTAQEAPPFLAYATVQDEKTAATKRLSMHELAALPQSTMEYKVGQYAELVTETGAEHQSGFDVIHAHDWMTYPAALELKAKTGKPLVTHIHSTEFDRIPSGSGSRFIMQTEYEGLQRADQVIAVSYYTKRLLVDKYAVDPNKIAVVHNGRSPSASAIDPGTHHFAQKRPVIVFMGRLTGQKGPSYFIELARKVVHKQPQTLFVIAGHGDMYQELLFSTAREGLSASVLFSGFVRDVQKDMLLDRADIFLMPSLSEPFGLVALEAAERHTPVIVSKNAGVSEVLPSALAIDFWDIDAMTRSIIELLANKEQRSTMVAAQSKEAAAVTWERAAERVQQVYRKAFLGK